MHYKMESKFNLDLHVKEASSIWVFGYGSLLWKPGFEFHSKQIGFIEGFARRFWQGNATHRGTPSSPGRVATLVKQEESTVWGVAFELKGDNQIKEAFEHLGVRECALGGYDTRVVPFVTRQVIDHHGNKLIVPALVFMALPENRQYLGEASIQELRDQVIKSKGKAGHNVEYVTKLADYIRTHIPEEQDPHLFELDVEIRRKLKSLKIPLHTLLTAQNSEHEEPQNASKKQRTFSGEDINQNIHTFSEDGETNVENWKCHDLPPKCPVDTQSTSIKVQS